MADLSTKVIQYCDYYKDSYPVKNSVFYYYYPVAIFQVLI